MSARTGENQAYFDKIATEYDQKNAAAVTQLERLLQTRKDLVGIGKGARFLDYACGTGMLSRVLGEDLTECIGIDLSRGMVDAYNAQAQSQGASRTAHQGNLADPLESDPPAFSDARFYNFDVIGVGLGWHHFDDCGLAARRLAQRLKPGGTLFVLDFVSHELDPARISGRGVQHHGFSRQDVQTMFETAGMGKDFAYEELAEPIDFQNCHGEGHGHHHDHDDDHVHLGVRRVFIARGSKL